MKKITKNLISVLSLVVILSVVGTNVSLASVTKTIDTPATTSLSAGSFSKAPVVAPVVVPPKVNPVFNIGGGGGTPQVMISAAPSVLTVPPSSTTTSIILNGVFIANGAQTTTMFEYSTNQSDLPNGQAGNGQIACQVLQAASANSGPFSCTLNVPAISANTIYFVRAIASNILGTDYGSTTSIKTLTTSSVPFVLTNVPSATSSSITFNGTFISNGAQTTTKFEYSTNQNNLPSGQPGTGQIVCQTLQLASVTSGPFSCTLNVPTITANTVYYVRAIASNINGTKYGNVTSIQTNNNQCTTPTISSLSPNHVTAGAGTTIVTVTGSNFYINSVAEVNGQARTTFLSNATSLTMTLTSSDVASSGNKSITVQNSSGCVSNVVTFTINPVSGGGGGGGGGGGYSYSYPSVTTQSASNVSTSSATLSGLVNPKGLNTTAWFEYGISTSLGSSTNAMSEGSINTNLALAQSITNLIPNTSYYFRAVANNSYGTTKGSILSFYTGNNTINASEIVTTVQAINKTTTSARLSGIFVNQDGITAQGYFQYGTSTSLGSSTNATNLGNSSSLNLSDTAKNLTPGTIYYFRAVALKQGVVYNGKILVFKTPSVIVHTNTNTNTNTNNNNNNSSNNLNDTLTAKVDTGPAIVDENQSSILTITNSTKEVSVNDEIDYLVTFKNDTSRNFENAKITIQLPQQVDFTNSNFGKMGEDNTVVFDAGILVPSQVGSMTIKGKVNSKAGAQNVLVTTAIMSYNATNSDLEKDEVAYVTNNVLAGSTGLEANSLFGAKFLPSTLLGWLALIFVILGLAAVSRIIYKNSSIKRNRASAGNANHIDNLPT